MNLLMAARSRFSTSTVIDSEYLVPWLSAEGPLACIPTKPPERDYFFQYTWILPGIFNSQVNLREDVAHLRLSHRFSLVALVNKPLKPNVLNE
jgi:hypothetical protein